MMMLQTPDMMVPAWLGQAEHLTLTGALIIAIVVLWRNLGEKDSQLIEQSKAVTGALSATTTSNMELRKIIEDSVRAKEELTISINRLSDKIERKV